MPYDDEDSIPPESIPPTRSRRRTTDHVSLRRILLSLAMSTPITVPGIWQGGKAALDAHAQWVELNKLPARIAALEAKLEEVDPHEAEIERLKRWQCIIGWDPPKSILPRDQRAQCRAPERDTAERRERREP